MNSARRLALTGPAGAVFPLASPRLLRALLTGEGAGVIGWMEAVVLGLLQGLTEFLPISSSAHIRVVSAFFGWQDPGAAFTAVIQLGTETAVLIYFRKEIWEIISTWTRSLWTPELRGRQRRPDGLVRDRRQHPDRRARSGVQGPDRGRFRDLRLVGTTLIVFGSSCWFADHTARNKLTSDKHLNVPHAVGLRLRPVARADPRRLPLGRHHHGRSAARLPARGGGQILVPAGHPRRAGLGRAGAVEIGERAGPGLGADDPGHDHLVRGRLRRRRLVPALHQHPPLHRLRRSTAIALGLFVILAVTLGWIPALG